jgi:hypothetical protein
MAAAAAAAVAHLSIHGRLRRSPEHRPSITTTTTSSSSSSAHRPSLLRCRAFKQEAGDGDPAEADARKRRKGPLYKLKAAIQGLAGSRSAAAEVYGGEYQYQRAVEKAEEIFFSVSTAPASARESLRRAPHPHQSPRLSVCSHTHLNELPNYAGVLLSGTQINVQCSLITALVP